jgi:hypothetical protein
MEAMKRTIEADNVIENCHPAVWVIFIIAATFFQLTIRNQHRQLAKDSRGLVATDRQRQDNPCPLLD